MTYMILGVVLLAVLAVLNPFRAKKLQIIGVGQRMMLLKRVTFPDLIFPRWQSVLAVSLIGVLIGLDPRSHTMPPGVPAWLGVVMGGMGLVTTWVAFPIIVAVLRWWLKRGGRWDGQGDLFNLVAASWLVADTLGAGLTALGVPPLLTLPLWLYSVWVGAQAIEGAIPQASLGYCIAGIAIGLVPAIVAAGSMFALVGVLMVVTGLVPGGAGA
ncbi:hypothetical protein ET532_020080 [Verminephrobacter sp. Larva24]|nr:hypothetical protein ET532_020080 [Verminephrobacter sp. Larva24]